MLPCWFSLSDAYFLYYFKGNNMLFRLPPCIMTMEWKDCICDTQIHLNHSVSCIRIFGIYLILIIILLVRNNVEGDLFRLAGGLWKKLMFCQCYLNYKRHRLLQILCRCPNTSLLQILFQFCWVLLNTRKYLSDLVYTGAFHCSAMPFSISNTF